MGTRAGERQPFARLGQCALQRDGGHRERATGVRLEAEDDRAMLLIGEIASSEEPRQISAAPGPSMTTDSSESGIGNMGPILPRRGPDRIREAPQSGP